MTFYPSDAVGSPPRCVEILILNDNFVEYDEEFTVSISSGGVIEAINVTSTVVTIHDDPADGA